ncbi:DUF4124 domain-containing protein [Pseudoxanthomonas sacheonensis]|uniref:DUF4124 domain-containing protein n=1 Tax=Pseudoxanthomonas sacheonensis TaxID=443615 RepID=UPI0013D60A58|nr:DUF4124 domain-containing protein [Pseudoxanthomonas sacheonensis]KAF1710814.1 hypothetical protein CSC73_04360 [Pseudoxanthomonas sacheonensis]
MKFGHVLPILLLFASSADADEVVFYRCTDASGALTMQNMPCPKGQKQEKKVMQSVSTVPMGDAAPAKPAPPRTPPSARPPATAPTAPSPPKPAEAVADGGAEPSAENRLPPPVLFQCVTYDKDTYITEGAEPQSRCVPLRTVGLDGNPQTGAGEACEMMRDQCARVADGALCEAWKKRMGETEVAWRFARPGNEAKNKAEFERTQKIWRESACGE